MIKKIIVLLIVFILYLASVLCKGNIIDTDKEEYISVEVRGEVEKEGCYRLKKGSTMTELLNLAVLKDTADITDISYLDVLYNQEIIVIPEIKEESTFLVSLNSASKEELMSLPGIGEKTAEKIIEYRKLYSFHSIDEIKNVSGIGDKKYEAIKEFLTL